MRKYIFTFIGAFIIPYIVLGVFIFLIDPYYVLHEPYFDMKAIRTNEAHYVARGLIRNMDYDILVCGSSMCENMHSEYIDDVFKGTSIKVIQHGSHSKDFAASLMQAANANKARIVILGLDSTLWKKPSNSYRIDGIPRYTVESPNLLNTAPYIFNVDNLGLCVRLLKANGRNGSIEPMNCWWSVGEEAYGRNYVKASWEQQSKEGYGLPGMDETLAWENYSNLVEGIEACHDQGIAVKLFIPPYSVADFSFYDYGRDLEVEKEIWRKLLEYDNVELYGVQFDTDLIQHFEWYRNTNHYNGLVCDMIIDDIANRKFLLTSDNIDEQTDRFKKFLDDYDWEKLETLFAN